MTVANNDDLDRSDRNDRWRVLAMVVIALLIGVVAWVLFAAKTDANSQASTQAAQKFTLAQQVAAACAVKQQADDLGGLCQRAAQVVKEGPRSNTTATAQGPQGVSGPLGPKGEPGATGPRGAPGARGAAGPPGPRGASGDDGAPGEHGTAGTAGVDGKDGAPGVDGAPGLPGVDGKDGAPGVDGKDGQSAFPFSFTFTTQDGTTFTCLVADNTVAADCTRPPANTSPAR